MNRTELVDFQLEITSNGFDVNDFELNGIDLTQWGSANPVLRQGTANVKRKSTGKHKSYATGHGTNWVVDFSTDLQLGYFN